MVLPASELMSPRTEDDHESYVEKQISVDPVSINLIAPPQIQNHHQNHPNKIKPIPISPKLQHLKSKFLSSSLPCSASSSPQFGPNFPKKKSKHQIPQPNSNSNSNSIPNSNYLARHHSIVLTQFAHHQDNHLPRSKSCGEGRASAPPDDFDLWLRKSNSIKDRNQQCSNGISSSASFSKIDPKLNGIIHSQTGLKMDHQTDEKFKCNALCLFIPGFGKGKPVRPRKQSEEDEELEPDSESGGGTRKGERIENNVMVVSRTVSLEKFECGSWTSSAIVQEEDVEDCGSNLFFDLPLELIRSNVNDADSPVRAAFVFDKDLKGVLKNGSSSRGIGIGIGEGKSSSQESSRHVRFSTSSQQMSHPTSPASCITPRLRKARDEFNAFLEAQTA